MHCGLEECTHMRMSTNKDWNKFLTELEEQGFDLTYKGKHIKLSKPDTPGFISLSKSPSDRRAIQNAKHMVKRYDYYATKCIPKSISYNNYNI